MTIHRMTSAEFDRDPERAKEVAENGPLFIDGEHHATHVLLAIGEYKKLGGEMSLLDALADHREGSDFDFDPPKLVFGLKPAEFD